MMMTSFLTSWFTSQQTSQQEPMINTVYTDVEMTDMIVNHKKTLDEIVDKLVDDAIIDEILNDIIDDSINRRNQFESTSRSISPNDNFAKLKNVKYVCIVRYEHPLVDYDRMLLSNVIKTFKGVFEKDINDDVTKTVFQDDKISNDKCIAFGSQNLVLLTAATNRIMNYGLEINYAVHSINCSFNDS
jgi:hypothetical protein